MKGERGFLGGLCRRTGQQPQNQAKPLFASWLKSLGSVEQLSHPENAVGASAHQQRLAMHLASAVAAQGPMWDSSLWVKEIQNEPWCNLECPL